MGAAYFYHLTQRPLEATLPTLIERARQNGWKVCLRGANPRRLELLDDLLWQGPETFLPHGIAGGAHDGDQPVLLTLDESIANNAQCLMTIEGAPVSDGEVKALERTCVLFDGADSGALEKARAQWRALTKAGCSAQYWSEESGRWEKKAEA